MKNKLLAGTALSLTAILSLTSCASGDAQQNGDQQNTGGGFVTAACTVIDYATIFSFSSCGSGDPSASPHVSGDASGNADSSAVDSDPDFDGKSPSTTDVAESVNDNDGKIGQKLVNGGVSLTVQKAEIVETIPMNRTGYETGTEYGKVTHEKPEEGGKFLRIDTKVENSSNVSMDLTCAWPIDAKALDSNDREFDAIDDLYYLENNPECNKALQPGFEADMSYIYLIPQDAAATKFKFRDPADESNFDYTTVAFDQPLK